MLSPLSLLPSSMPTMCPISHSYGIVLYEMTFFTVSLRFLSKSPAHLPPRRRHTYGMKTKKGLQTYCNPLSSLMFWRRERDLNSRYRFKPVYSLSRRAPSADSDISPCAFSFYLILSFLSRWDRVFRWICFENFFHIIEIKSFVRKIKNSTYRYCNISIF